MRLIDADALINDRENFIVIGAGDNICIDISDIAKAPTIEAEPVKHGRWIEPSRLYYGAKQYECSLCYSDTFWKKHSITEKYPHCPNCGCRMDGGDDE